MLLPADSLAITAALGGVTAVCADGHKVVCVENRKHLMDNSNIIVHATWTSHQ